MNVEDPAENKESPVYDAGDKRGSDVAVEGNEDSTARQPSNTDTFTSRSVLGNPQTTDSSTDVETENVDNAHDQAQMAQDADATGVKVALEINAMGTEHMHLVPAQNTGSADTTASPARDAVIESVDPPSSRYTMDEKKLKQRVFPCPGCGEGADGSHQCGDCFAHVHVICGKPYEGSHEGFGQLLQCGKCNDPYDDGTCTQVWHEEEIVNGQQSSNASPEEVVQHSQNKVELERVLLAQFIAGLPKVASPDTSQKPKRKKVVGNAEKKKRKREILKLLEDLRSTKKSKAANRSAHGGSDVPEHNGGKRKRKQEIQKLVEELRLLMKKKAPDTSAHVVDEYPQYNAKIQSTDIKEHVAKSGPSGSVNSSTMMEQHTRYNEQAEDGIQWDNDEWYWDEGYQTWVFHRTTKARPKDLTNKMERNWLLGMRRNWETEKKAKMIDKITIKRNNMNMIRTFTCPQIELIRVY